MTVDVGFTDPRTAEVTAQIVSKLADFITYFAISSLLLNVLLILGILIFIRNIYSRVVAGCFSAIAGIVGTGVARYLFDGELRYGELTIKLKSLSGTSAMENILYTVMITTMVLAIIAAMNFQNKIDLSRAGNHQRDSTTRKD